MAAHGKIEVDLEVVIGAEKFWHSIRESTSLFPKAFPDQYKSIEVLEGDGKAVGSIRLIKYADGKSTMLIGTSIMYTFGLYQVLSLFVTDMVELDAKGTCAHLACCNSS